MATNAGENTTPSPQFILEATRVINSWQRCRLQLIQLIAEKTLENLASTPAIDIDSLSNDLDRLLFNDINPHVTFSPCLSITDSAATCNHEYGGNDDEDEKISLAEFTSTPALQSRPGPPSEQMSIDSFMTESKGQAITIKQTTDMTYSCYSDSDNGVMALNGDELVYIDWVWKQNRSGRHKIRIVTARNNTTKNDHPTQDSFRSIFGPRELDNMRVVDMDYIPQMSKYIMAVVERISPHTQSPMARTSLLYLFDSKDDSFTLWKPFNSISEKMGLVTRVCCCPKQPFVYLLMNVFGRSDLIILNGDGTLLDWKHPDSLPLKDVGTRLVDISCTANNDRLALAFNSSTFHSSGNMGVCFVDPKTWIRIASIDLKETNIPFTIPRLAWIDKQALFVIINDDGNLLVSNWDGELLGERTFACSMSEHEKSMKPTNICAAQCHWVAIRYERCINVHRVLS